MSNDNPLVGRGRILIVDDERANRKLLQGLIRWLGHEPVLAESGTEALRIIEEEGIELVLLDLMMPEVDGFEVLRQLGRRGVLPDLPVVVVTALEERETQIKALELGALDFISKPFNRHELACRVKNLLRLKRAQDALHSKKEELEATVLRRTDQYKALLETAPDLIFAITPSGIIEYVNRAPLNSNEDLVGRNILSFAVTGLGKHAEETLRLAASSEELVTFCLEAEFVPGSPRTYNVRLRRLPVSPFQESRVLLFATDVTDGLSAKRDLKETLRRMELIQQHQPLMLYEVKGSSHGATPVWSSRGAEEILGFELSESLKIEELFSLVHPDDRSVVLDFASSLRLNKPENWTFEHRISRPDGSFRWVLHFGRMIQDPSTSHWRIVGWGLDITERRELEQSLYQKQKMEALGHLAGGVAHDFNNLLTVIISHASLIQDLLPPKHDLIEEAEAVLQSAERAGNLTRQLLDFSRLRPVRPELLDLNESVAKMMSLLERTLGSQVNLRVNTSDGPAMILADATKIDQVILNLAVNARDAMPNGGTLTLRVANISSPEQSLEEWVELTVTDTGVGMSDEVQSSIFQPFFSTKDPESGTGLGLSTCYGIVKRLEGDISVHSSLGLGTTFTVKIPSYRERRSSRTGHRQVGYRNSRGEIQSLSQAYPTREAL